MELEQRAGAEVDDSGSDRQDIYNYRTDKILGKGGTGTVYRAVDRNTKHVVAIKLFHANFFRSRFHIRDIARSLKKCKKLDHPNVAKVYDFIVDDRGIVMVQEYVDGPDLKWYLANRPFDLYERLGIAQQILTGLQYLHDHKITHHDLKPSNVLFSKKGVAKLCDYSLGGNSFFSIWNSKLAEQVTPMYVSPEIIEKNKATPKSDLYSCGIMFYVLFANDVPFKVDSLDRLYFSHLKLLPDPPSMVNPKLPKELSDVIMRMIAKDPKDRFRDCDEIRLIFARLSERKI